MKALFLTMIFALTTMLTFAQKSEHLTFKGIPIDGTLSMFVSKLKQNGFTYLQTEDGVAMLKGEFASYSGSIVGVATSKGKDLVSKITVIFPTQDNWALLSSNYFNLKELLSEKYGEPAESIEEFSSHEPEDDGTKMIQVHLDACKYFTSFKTDKGDIQLSIRGDISNAFVMLAYYDKINSEIIRNKAKGDL
jgi:hypothetical protein